MLKISLLRAECPPPLPLPAGVVPSRTQRALSAVVGLLAVVLLAALLVRR